MQKSGAVHIGTEYATALEDIKALTKARNHPEALRRLVDAACGSVEVQRAVTKFIGTATRGHRDNEEIGGANA